MTIAFDLTGTTVVITGSASGIGAATTDLLLASGAEVHAIDIEPVAAPVHAIHRCDLGETDSIDAALGLLPDTVDVLMNCAGVPNGGRFTTEQVMRVNWFGLRHLTEALLPRINPHGAVVHVASTAGRAWPEHQRELDGFMAASSFDDGVQLMGSHTQLCGDGYAFSKELVQYYTMWRAPQLTERGVRMNSVCPGVTRTDIAADFRRGMGDQVVDAAIEVAGRMAEPDEMAPAMLFLADHSASSYVNGVNLNIDRGTGAARITAA